MTPTINFAWLTALLILAQAPGGSPQASPPTEHAFAAQGAFIALVVTDLNTSLRWYQSNLDLHLIKQGRSPRVAAETAVLSGHNMFVELIHYTDRSLAKREINDAVPIAGPMKVGAIVDPLGFDALTRDLHNHGIEVRSFEDKEMACRSFIMQDSDGNLIQFFAKTN